MVVQVQTVQTVQAELCVCARMIVQVQTVHGLFRLDCVRMFVCVCT